MRDEEGSFEGHGEAEPTCRLASANLLEQKTEEGGVAGRVLSNKIRSTGGKINGSDP